MGKYKEQQKVLNGAGQLLQGLWLSTHSLSFELQNFRFEVKDQLGYFLSNSHRFWHLGYI